MSRTLRDISDIKSLHNKRINRKLNKDDNLTEEEVLQKLERGQMPATAAGAPNSNSPHGYNDWDQVFHPHGKKVAKRQSHHIQRQHDKEIVENELSELEAINSIDKYDDEVRKLLDTLQPVLGGYYKALNWYETKPLEKLGNKTPKELMQNGKFEQVKNHVEKAYF